MSIRFTQIWIQILVQDTALCMSLNLLEPGYSLLQNGGCNRKIHKAIVKVKGTYTQKAFSMVSGHEDERQWSPFYKE